MKNTPVKDLYNSCVQVKPRDYDWTEGYAEKWESHEASRCEECNKLVIGRNGERHCDLDSDTECQGYVPTNEGPMMNYYYPLPEYRFSDDAVLAIADLPLCIVEFLDSGEHGLALTGGGMDLSWEICEAFMRLGFLPPLHFCDLPQMAGRGQSVRDRWIIAGCRRSAQIVKLCAGNTLRRLRVNFKPEGEAK